MWIYYSILIILLEFNINVRSETSQMFQVIQIQNKRLWEVMFKENKQNNLCNCSQDNLTLLLNKKY